MLVKTLLQSIVAATAVTSASAAQLEQIQSFGQNPTKIQMHLYVPDKVAANPVVIVGLHPCGGSGPSWFRGTKLPSYADQHGWVLIFPGTPNMSNCWDVQSVGSLTHGSGGDARGIISMVEYVYDKYKGNRNQTFVMGSSSGGMMTNVMAGTYPEYFEAGAAYSGTAHACFAGAPSATPFSPNQTCAQGLQHTPEEWGNFVRNAYPGYTGKRPRMQIFHGLADTLVRPQCAIEAMKQWGNVLGLQSTQNISGVPSAAYTRYVYGDGTKLEGYLGQGVGHTAPVNEPVMLKFWGLIT
jgi:poly(hydroxyalkanoate) depolymerase family esterase